MRVSSATSGEAPPAAETGDFRRVFALQLHAKVRGYDACRRGRSARAEETSVTMENGPHLRLFGTQNACKGPADDGRVQNVQGPPGPQTFRIIYREAQ
jgi:hypothetical protein